MRCLEVPSPFKQPIWKMYPPHHTGPLIEDYAANYFKMCAPIPGWCYIPINWTGFYCNNGYGKATKGLRSYVQAMNLKASVGLRYFTVVQCDDGTACDDLLQKAGVVIFGAGGCGDYPLPLLCAPHPVEAREKKYLASFCGSLDTTNQPGHGNGIRKLMADVLRSHSDVFLGHGGTNLFRSVMNESIFALCPRGYGRTSFRLYEAIQMGVIPVYVVDDCDAWLPFWSTEEWCSFCIMCDSTMLPFLYETLSAISQDQTAMANMRASLAEHAKFMTFEYSCKWVEEKIRGMAA